MPCKNLPELILAFHVGFLPALFDRVRGRIFQVGQELLAVVFPRDVLCVQFRVFVNDLVFWLELANVMPRVRQYRANGFAFFKANFVSFASELPIHRKREWRPVCFDDALKGRDAILELIRWHRSSVRPGAPRHRA